MGKSQLWRRVRTTAGRGLIAVALAVAVVAALAAAVHVPPAKAVSTLLSGAYGGAFAWSGTLLKTTPILLTGLAVAWAFRAGLFNIGAEGQLLWGAVAAAWVGRVLPVPGPLAALAALLAGAIAGAVWAWPAAVLKIRRNAPEVVTTLLLSFIAIHLTSFLATHPLHDPDRQGPRTAEVVPGAFLPVFPVLGVKIRLGLLIALGIAVLLGLVLARGRLGFQIGVVGRNPEAARSSNLPVARIWTLALLQSGALAGLAGALEVLGLHHYFEVNISSGAGYTGIAVAILGANTPLGVVLASLFWGGLANGAPEMELETGISKYLVTVIQALVVLLVAVRRWPALPLPRPRKEAAPPAPVSPQAPI